MCCEPASGEQVSKPDYQKHTHHTRYAPEEFAEQDCKFHERCCPVQHKCSLSSSSVWCSSCGAVLWSGQTVTQHCLDLAKRRTASTADGVRAYHSALKASSRHLNPSNHLMHRAPLRDLGTQQHRLGVHVIWLVAVVAALQRQRRRPAGLTNLENNNHVKDLDRRGCKYVACRQQNTSKQPVGLELYSLLFRASVQQVLYVLCTVTSWEMTAVSTQY